MTNLCTEQLSTDSFFVLDDTGKETGYFIGKRLAYGAAEPSYQVHIGHPADRFTSFVKGNFDTRADALKWLEIELTTKESDRS